MNSDQKIMYHCLNLWEIPRELAAPADGEKEDQHIPNCLRDRAIQKFIKSKEGPFEDNELSSTAPISFLEQLVVVAALSFVMGGPLVWFGLGIFLTFFGSWLQVLLHIAGTFALAFHPMPKLNQRHLQKSWFVFALYKYFSYRFVWSGDVRSKAQSCGSWVGAGVPHGVMPFANLLSMVAINSFSFVGPFYGAPASVVFNTPFLRYFTLLGDCCHVGRKSLERELSKGHCVGLVPDGIAGIFRCNHEHEAVYLKNRKGLARLCLRTGHAIFPAYSMGNTSAFTAWFDPFGLMENVSRKIQASFFIYWGKWYLPIPHRVPITLLIGQPVTVPHKVENASPEQVDEVHQRILSSIRRTFDEHKNAMGWGHKQMTFV